MTAVCVTCGAELLAGARFCAACGTAVAGTCDACATPLPDDARFCPACGAERAPGDPAATSALVERKLVTALFADLVGSTSLAEREDPEHLRYVMDRYFSVLRITVERAGGTVGALVGDAVSAVFGVPAAHDDDPARALRAAVELHAAVAELAETVALPLSLRIGVSTGHLLADLASLDLGTLVGDVMNVAARFEQAASPGETIVGERTMRACRGMAFESVGSLQLKGKDSPVPAWRLVEVREVERGLDVFSAALVGRESELALLRAIYDRVVSDGRPALVTVEGEAGVGKSRLTRELCAVLTAADDAPLVLRGRCLPYGDAVYWPLAEILKSLAGMLDNDPPEIARERVAEAAGKLLRDAGVAEVARVADVLSFSVGAHAGDDSLHALLPQEARVEIHAAWRELFSALTLDRPAVVVVEDIHWADDALLDLLEDVVTRAHGPLLLVCPTRPDLAERRPGWGGVRVRASTVTVEPLASDDAEHLLSLLVDVDLLPAAARRRLLESTEGNPFFIEEVIRSFVDAGHMVYEADRWIVTSPLEDITIPDTVQGVLAARIDLLDTPTKRTLQLASVIGRVFWGGAVVALAGNTVDSALDALAGRGFVFYERHSSIAGEQEFRFKHVLTREVAYGSLSRRDRADAHERVASWINELAGDRRGEFVELLAHHWIEAYRGTVESPRPDATLVAMRRATAFEAAMTASGEAHAKMTLRSAIQFAEQAVDLAPDVPSRSDALAQLAQCHFDTTAGEPAWRAWTRAVDERLEDGDHGERVAELCALAVEIATRWPGTTMNVIPEAAAARYLDIGLAHATPGDSPARARLLTARAFWQHGYPSPSPVGETNTDADADAEAAAAMAERLGLADLASAALDALQNNRLEASDYTGSLALNARRLRLVDSMKDLREVGDALAMASMGQAEVGNVEAAFDHATVGYERLVEIFPGQAVHCLAWRATARYLAGDWDGLLDDIATIDRLHESEITGGFARPWPAAALVCERRSDREGADAFLRVAQRAERGRMNGHLSPDIMRLLAMRGDVAAARERKDAVSASSAGNDLDRMLARWCDVVGDAELWDEAAAHLEVVRMRYVDPAQRALPPHADRLDGRLALMQGDSAHAVQLLGRSRDGFAAIGARYELAIAEMFLAQGLAATGLATEATKLLATTEATLTALQSRTDLMRLKQVREQIHA